MNVYKTGRDDFVSRVDYLFCAFCIKASDANDFPACNRNRAAKPGIARPVYDPGVVDHQVETLRICFCGIQPRRGKENRGSQKHGK
jgi:hypothetical protein